MTVLYLIFLKPFDSQRIETGLEHIPISFSVLKFFRASTVVDGRAGGRFGGGATGQGMGRTRREHQVDTSNLEAFAKFLNRVFLTRLAH